MSGTHAGSIKAKNSLIADLGEEGYRKHLIERGRKGGLSPKSKPAGFAAMNREKHLEASRKGGETSRRNK